MTCCQLVVILPTHLFNFVLMYQVVHFATTISWWIATRKNLRFLHSKYYFVILYQKWLNKQSCCQRNKKIVVNVIFLNSTKWYFKYTVRLTACWKCLAANHLEIESQKFGDHSKYHSRILRILIFITFKLFNFLRLVLN